ncbi:MAG: 30S ribosomal protein S20, partial [Myxococcales bacterium]|nr:30S ribosomal protein S20 [Myxococcales bacterium]
MANIKSQKKRILTNERARLRNKSVKSALKTAIKRVDAAIVTGDADA